MLASASTSQGMAFDRGAAPSVPPPGAASFAAVPMPMPGPSPYSGSYRMVPAPRRDSGRRGGLVLLFVAVSLVVWAVLAWAWLRDDPADAASSTPAAPAKEASSGRPSAVEKPAAVAAPADVPEGKPVTEKQREERRRAAAKRLEEQKRAAEKWREEQRRAAAKRRGER